MTELIKNQTTDLGSDTAVPLQSLVVVRALGKGGSSTVLEVFSDQMKHNFAMKIIPRNQQAFSDTFEVTAFENEIRILRLLRHAHMVRLVGSYTQGDRLLLLISPVA